MSRLSESGFQLPPSGLSFLVNQLIWFNVCQMANCRSTLLLQILLFFCESREAKSLPVMNPEHGVKCRDRRKAHMSSEGAKSTNPVVDIVMNALTRKIV